MNHDPQNPPNSSEIAQRHTTNETAFVEVQGRAGKILCRMNNLSKTGAFFEIVNSHFTPKQGDLVRVTINLKQLNKTHTLHGQIIWNRGLGLGIAFLKSKDVFKKIHK